MTFTYLAAVIVSAVLFIVYGLLCLFSNGMADEFERYGLSRFRRMTGRLEVLGGIGLLGGLLAPVFMVIASGGLALLMLLGLFARIRVRDPLLEMLPAAFLFGANVFIELSAWGDVGSV